MKEKIPKDDADFDVESEISFQSDTSDEEYKNKVAYMGPTTRKAWSDWCRNKTKPNQNDEDPRVKGIFSPY